MADNQKQRMIQFDLLNPSFVLYPLTNDNGISSDSENL
eukprot:CAMPEP_0116006198 /NCGR_PEP_ID=MMETSP0321-20121206/1591_1 /TAXON_ID=163516 /ORGANISM="Leptocylindrus danicus var. danicus, Strain B650" /LENGTH=37 /DNA_ID= /DNA_START= /DNA_END= /DNA_ORIENTATION=